MLTPAAACTKLLHVGNDRELAYRLAGALQRARQDVVMASVGRLADAKRWVSDNDNDFPKPVKLSPRRIGWRKKDVVAWLEQRR